MHALPFVAGLLIALIVVPAALELLRESGFVRPNWHGTALPFPAGSAIVASALVALAPVALLDALGVDVLTGSLRSVLIYAVGVAFLGLLDDVIEAEPRGWRGHAATVRAGRLSTGALKAVGSLGLALVVLDGAYDSRWRYFVAVALLLLATNLWNLLDLRPGRTIKALVLLGAGLTVGKLAASGAVDRRAPEALGVFLGPALVAGAYDLRERAMLGDTGSNLLGALAGIWLLLTFGATGQAVALGVLALITLYGEFRSISAFVERTPGLRHLDSWGRPNHA